MPASWWRRNWLDLALVALILGLAAAMLVLLLRRSPLVSTAGTGQTGGAASTPAAPATSTPGPNASVATDPVVSRPTPSDGASVDSATTNPVLSETAEPPAEPASSPAARPAPAVAPGAVKPATVKPATVKPAITPTPEAPAPAAVVARPETPSTSTQAPASPPGPGAASSQAGVAAARPAPTPAAAATAPSAPTLSTPAPLTPAPSIPAPFTSAPSTPAPSTAAAPSPAAPVRTEPATREEYRRSYRVGVAAYTSAGRAERLAASLRAGGQAAFAVPSRDNLTVVLVGPFADEASASRALAGVRTRHPDAILYRPQSQAAVPGGAAGASTAPSTPQVAPAAEPAATDATATGTYFQVGAFKQAQSARPLLESLRGAGYPVTVRSSPDGFTRVLLGPVPASEAASTKASLQARGLSPFVSR